MPKVVKLHLNWNHFGPLGPLGVESGGGSMVVGSSTRCMRRRANQSSAKKQICEKHRVLVHTRWNLDCLVKNICKKLAKPCNVAVIASSSFRPKVKSFELLLHVLKGDGNETFFSILSLQRKQHF